MHKILLVDDDPEMTRTLAEYLGDHDYDTVLASSGSEAIEVLRERSVDAVVTDLRMRSLDGLDLLDAARRMDDTVPVILMTAFGTIDSAIEAIRRGAHHYLTKPFKLRELLVYLERALADRAIRVEHLRLAREVGAGGEAVVVGASGAMRQVLEAVERVAGSAATVLLRGESGTGKEVIARVIHQRGPRAARSFVPINCSALPPGLLEAELFGFERGAFTGAVKQRRGLFAEADGGTLFLDEIAELAPELQAKLLRVLQDGEIRPLGTDRPRRVDVRLLAATHRDLEAAVREARFREDLYYRVNVIPIALPPLRERREDIPDLARHFLLKFRAQNASARAFELSPEAMQRLTELGWPGNVRELANAIERLVVLCPRPRIDVGDLGFLGGRDVQPLEEIFPTLPTLRDLEARYVEWVLERVGGSKAKAAEILGIDPSTLYRRSRHAGP